MTIEDYKKNISNIIHYNNETIIEQLAELLKVYGLLSNKKTYQGSCIDKEKEPVKKVLKIKNS